MIDFTFIAERYNYWIFIVLMMIGLFTVISHGNLIKKIVGLNIFQTSVFIYYISVGKIAGGTAPILIGGEDHGGEHNAGAAGEAALRGAADNDINAVLDAVRVHAQSELHTDPGLVRNPPPGDEKIEIIRPEEGGPGPEAGAGQPLHAAPTANPPLSGQEGSLLTVPPPPSQPAPTFEIAPPVDAAHYAAAANPLEALHPAAEIIYTNPLPHVLILTAIVVGVATTAVGLALAVRIREAYGAIEEDELEAADDIAEFGRPMTEGAGAR
jgi:multicomponent Na+:H+ antiporter subunit C